MMMIIIILIISIILIRLITSIPRTERETDENLPKRAIEEWGNETRVQQSGKATIHRFIRDTASQRLSESGLTEEKILLLKKKKNQFGGLELKWTWILANAKHTCY